MQKLNRFLTLVCLLLTGCPQQEQTVTGSDAEKKIRDRFSIIERFADEPAYAEFKTANLQFPFHVRDQEIIRTVYKATVSPHGGLLWNPAPLHFACLGQQETCRLRILLTKTWKDVEGQNKILLVGAENIDIDSFYTQPTILGYILLHASHGEQTWSVKTAVPAFTAFQYGIVQKENIRFLLASTFDEGGSVYQEAHFIIKHDACDGLPEKRSHHCRQQLQLWWLDFGRLRQHLAVNFDRGVLEKPRACSDEIEGGSQSCVTKSTVTARADIAVIDERRIILNMSYRSEPETAGEAEAWHHQMTYALQQYQPHLVAVR